MFWTWTKIMRSKILTANLHKAWFGLTCYSVRFACRSKRHFIGIDSILCSFPDFKKPKENSVLEKVSFFGFLWILVQEYLYVSAFKGRFRFVCRSNLKILPRKISFGWSKVEMWQLWAFPNFQTLVVRTFVSHTSIWVILKREIASIFFKMLLNK